MKTIMERWSEAKSTTKIALENVAACYKEAREIVLAKTGQDLDNEVLNIVTSNPLMRELKIYKGIVSGVVSGYNSRDNIERPITGHWASTLKAVEMFATMLPKTTGEIISIWEKGQE